MKVSIPFWEMFKEPMLNGQKVMTSRTKKYGNMEMLVTLSKLLVLPLEL